MANVAKQIEERSSAQGPGWPKKLAVLLVTSLVLTLLAELGIRTLVPANKFIDRKTDCYWITRIKLRAEDDATRLTNVAHHPRLGWTMKSSRRGAKDESTNRFGMRGARDVKLERTEGVRRAVVLGDSFTFGLGVDDASTYCSRLEALEPNLEVLNLGVNGYGTDQQQLFWEIRGWRFQPDLVLIGIYVPDFHRNGLSVRELPKPRYYVREGELELCELPLPVPLQVLEERLPTCRSPLRLMDLVGYLKRWARGTEPDETFDEKATLMAGILRLLRDSTHAKGARFAVLILPDQTFREYEDHRRIETVIENASADLGVPVLNLTEPMSAWQAANPEIPAYGDHGHWSPEGHDVGAREILAFLKQEELL